MNYLVVDSYFLINYYHNYTITVPLFYWEYLLLPVLWDFIQLLKK